MTARGEELGFTFRFESGFRVHNTFNTHQLLHWADTQDRKHDQKQILLSGVGHELLRGLPINTYSQAFVATIFCGIGAPIGSARSQNADGHILGHVRDIGAGISRSRLQT